MTAVAQKSCLVKEAVDKSEMFSRIGGKYSSCGIRASDIERTGTVPQGI